MDKHTCGKCKCKLFDSDDNEIYFCGIWLIGYLCDKCREIYQKVLNENNDI